MTENAAGSGQALRARRARRSRLVLGILVVLVPGLFALYLGGTISLTPGKIDISAPRQPAAATAAAVTQVDQKAAATSANARAINALGDVNGGTAGMPGAAAQPVPARVVQKATADGKGAEAINAVGDVNLK